jgi:hypothetical protein
MNQLSIRNALEDKAKELGGKIIGAGSLVVPPYTMDFSFERKGKKYSVTIVDVEEQRRAIADGIKGRKNVTERA